MNAAIQKYNTLGWPLPMCNSTLGSAASSFDLSDLISKMLPAVQHDKIRNGLEGLLTPGSGWNISLNQIIFICTYFLSKFI